MRVTILCPAYPPMPGGVSDFTQRFAEALADLGPEAMRPESWPLELTVITGPQAGPSRQAGRVRVVAEQARWGALGMPSLLRRLRASAPDVVVVQYVPHLFQRQGLSVPMAEAVALMRRMGYRVLTIAHELYYGRHEGWKVQPYGWVQRYALLPLFWGSARVALTVPDRLSRMRAVFPRWAEKFTLVPVGANMGAASPEMGAAWRRKLGLGPDALLLLFVGLAHPSKELETLALTLDRLAEAGIDAHLALLGGGTLDHPRAIARGYAPAAEAEAALVAADLYVLPLADGASTRRTSLMNALAAGLPVVSTRGANTDPARFPPEALRLAPAGDPRAFAEAVVALARDPEARRRLGAAGQALYRTEFAWEVLARRWMALLEAAREA